MNKFELKVRGEDDRVQLSLSTKDVNLSVENARFFADALHQAASHAEGKGAYEHEVSLFYRDDDEEETVGFDTKPKKKSKKEEDK